MLVKVTWTYALLKLVEVAIVFALDPKVNPVIEIEVSSL